MTFTIVLEWVPLILQGFVVDLWASVLAMIFGSILGGLVGVGRTSKINIISITCQIITNIFRNSPFLVLVFFFVLLIPYNIIIFDTEIHIPGLLKAITGMSLVVMSYVSDVVRGGIESIPSSQWEAAQSLALKRRVILSKIIFPQAFRRMLAPWMNVYAMLVMSTPLISIVGVHDAVYLTQSALSSENDPSLMLPMWGFTLLLFFAYCWLVSLMVSWLEWKNLQH